MTDERDGPQVERFDDGRQVVRVRVHVVAGGGLARAAMPASVMGNHAKALLGKEMHLPVPCVGIQRPPMGEGDDRASTPVFVVDRRSVFAGNDVHGLSTLCWARGAAASPCEARASAAGGVSMGHSGVTVVAEGLWKSLCAGAARVTSSAEFSGVKRC